MHTYFDFCLCKHIYPIKSGGGPYEAARRSGVKRTVLWAAAAGRCRG
jgi:hypothetical protein